MPERQKELFSGLENKQPRLGYNYFWRVKMFYWGGSGYFDGGRLPGFVAAH